MLRPTPRRPWLALVLTSLPVAATAAEPTAPPATTPTAPAARKSPWTPTATLAVKEEFDGNVFLQDVRELADRESWITTVTPAVGLKYSPDASFRASVSYAPEIAFFHSESSEDFVLHRMGLGLGGKADGTEWDVQNTLLSIDGSDTGLTFAGPGGAPAAGGPRLRDRRDALVYRGALKVTQSFGRWLVRPVATAYVHDFQTRQSTAPGYLNYVDRNEWVGGLDGGLKLGTTTQVFLGYRYGVQDQSHLLAFPEEYDNTFHRVLASVEGNPLSWAKVSLSLGPEFRRYGDRVPAAFGDKDELNLFVEGSVTCTVSKADAVTVSIKQFEQPGFTGRSAYEDLTYDLIWRHKLAPKASFAISGRAYSTDFLDPAKRNDWVLSGSAAAAYDFTSKLQAELSFTYERGLSEVPNTSGREYTREVVALGCKYTFR